ncbi:MAG: lysoplasmalogenase [bacterium]|nr:lysoplasmalogenase [bacterium]
MFTWIAGTAMYVAVSLLVEAERRQSRRLAWLSKPTASLTFVAIGFARWYAGDPIASWMIAALVLCAIGDILLIEDASFDFGLAAFLLGHVAYVTAFASAFPVSSWPRAFAAALVTFAVGVLCWLWSHIRARRATVSTYIFLITFMVWGALAVSNTGAAPLRVAIGAILFFVSDLTVARNRFLKREFVNRAIGLPFYYTGQLLLALSVGEIG